MLTGGSARATRSSKPFAASSAISLAKSTMSYVSATVRSVRSRLPRRDLFQTTDRHLRSERVLGVAGCPRLAGVVACYDHGAGWRWATRFHTASRGALGSEKMTNPACHFEQPPRFAIHGR